MARDATTGTRRVDHGSVHAADPATSLATTGTVAQRRRGRVDEALVDAVGDVERIVTGLAGHRRQHQDALADHGALARQHQAAHGGLGEPRLHPDDAVAFRPTTRSSWSTPAIGRVTDGCATTAAKVGIAMAAWVTSSWSPAVLAVLGSRPLASA